MPKSMPYLPSNKNIGILFERIAAARTPDVLTQAVLGETLGLKSNADRALITLLKQLGFLDQSGKPSPTYHLLKNKEEAAPAIAAGIKHAYEPLFTANEKAHTLAGDALKGLIAQVAGTDQDQSTRIAYTFSALVRLADFNKTSGELSDEHERERTDEEVSSLPPKKIGGGLRPDFHYNIQVHLPSNGTEETYLNIFNALRKAFS